MKKIILIALILRLSGIFVFRYINNFDLHSYIKVGELTFKGINIYPEIAKIHHPYFPTFLYIEAFAYWISRNKTIVITIIKFITVIFDLGNLYLIYILSNKNFKKIFLYAVNPVSILVFTLHGQFDAIPLFFLLGTLYLIKVKKDVFALLTYSCAVMIKTWPLLFFLSIYKRLKNKKIISLIGIFPLLSIIIYSFFYNANMIDIVKTIINYQGLWGIWGPWMFLANLRLRWQKLSTSIFLLIFFLFSHLKNSKSVYREIFYLLFFFYVFSPTFSIQYFSWLMPFLTIVKPKNYWQIVLSISGYLGLSYLSWQLPQINQDILNTFGLILWFYLASIFWMAYRKKFLD